MNHAFTGMILGKYECYAFSCPDCGFLQIVDPHWLSEAYTDAIADSDTGLVARNISLSNQLSPLLFYLFGTDGIYVDFAGGTGLLVRLMRDIGFDYYWNDQYCQNIHARGFEFDINDRMYDVVTAFEVLEHVQDPVSFLMDTLEKTKAKVFVISTECFEGLPPDYNEWWYYSFHSGQHISFYQIKTLKYIASCLDLSFINVGSLYVFCDSCIKEKIYKFNGSRWTQMLTRFRLRKHLKSKTLSDHLIISGRL